MKPVANLAWADRIVDKDGVGEEWESNFSWELLNGRDYKGQAVAIRRLSARELSMASRKQDIARAGRALAEMGIKDLLPIKLRLWIPSDRVRTLQ